MSVRAMMVAMSLLLAPWFATAKPPFSIPNDSSPVIHSAVGVVMEAGEMLVIVGVNLSDGTTSPTVTLGTIPLTVVTSSATRVEADITGKAPGTYLLTVAPDGAPAAASFYVMIGTARVVTYTQALVIVDPPPGAYVYIYTAQENVISGAAYDGSAFSCSPWGTHLPCTLHLVPGSTIKQIVSWWPSAAFSVTCPDGSTVTATQYAGDYRAICGEYTMNVPGKGVYYSW